MACQYYVYLMASKSRVLYVGVTSNLQRRVHEHKAGEIDGFSRKYKVNRLVHYEVTTEVRSALAREKELKGWRRTTKVELIETTNPLWNDLSEEWDTRELHPD
jgi:putative endonuclease